MKNIPYLSDLVRGASAGVQSDWDALVDELGPLVWSVARGCGLSPDDAADVAQVAWLQLARHISFIADPLKVPGWLAVTTRREAVRFKRKVDREIPTPSESFDRPLECGFDDRAIAASESGVELLAALDTLHLPCQLLVRLLLCDPEPSYAMISETLGISINNVGSRKTRCLRMLKAAFEKVTAV